MRFSFPLFIAIGLVWMLTPSPHSRGGECDVIVYGSTPGGFCAAIGAAREGASVILLEPTNQGGGVNTGGLFFSDSNQTVRKYGRMGLFDEWHTRIEKDYQERGVALPYKVSEKDHKPWTYEPGVAVRIMRSRCSMKRRSRCIEEPHPEIGDQKEGKAASAELVTTDGTFKAKVFVDATYEGDLMAAAGVSWTIGREGRKDYGESLAGKQFPKSAMPISGRGSEGKLLPLITTADAGPDEAGDRNVMVYSFRLCLTKDPANRVPFPQPTAYDPARFEVVRRHFAQEKHPILLWDIYPLPNGKFDANNGIGKQFSIGLVAAGNGWCEADSAGRARIWDAHKQYTLELYHFLTTDPAVPENLRLNLARIRRILPRRVCGQRSHWSPQLCSVREGRHMKGLYVLSQNDIQGMPAKEDAIAVSSFPIDSHDCQRVALNDDKVIDEGTIMPVRMSGRRHGPVYQVPYRSIVPQMAECENLLVPVALSCTHVAYCSLRVEPTWMILGQSAGVAAALAARKGTSVQKLPYPALRERLLAQHQVLDLPILPDIAPPAPTAAGVDPTKR